MSKATLYNDKKKTLVPQLRFQEFDGVWKSFSINELVNKKILDKPLDGNHGNIHPVSSDFVSSGIPFVMANCFRDGKLLIERAVCIRKEQADKLQKGFSIKDDVLLTHKGSVGLTAIVPKLDTEYIMLTPQVTYYRILKPEILINVFLKSTFETTLFQKRLKVLADGGTRPYIGITMQRILNISIPANHSEQKKIASFLSEVDEKIQQLTRKISLLDQYKKGVMQQLFSGKLRFKYENEKDYPKWEEKKLGEYLIYKSNRNKDFKVELVLSVSNKKGFISQDEQFDGYEVASKDLSNYKIVDKNDIAYNPSRINVGSIARLIKYEKGIVSPMYVVFSLKNNLNEIFFENLYNTHRFKHLIKVGCSGSVRDSLNFEDLAEFKFKFPCLEEQQKIAKFLSDIDSKIEKANQQLAQTQTFKKGLLQQMFV